MFVYIYFFVFVHMCMCNAINEDDTKLLLTHVLLRHGDRTPEHVDFYPTDPYLNMSFYPLERGQLTNIGKQHVFELGQILRRRYDSFLGPLYHPSLIETVSTDFERTKMSALLVLAGLFPPSKNETWNSDLPWMPIPFKFKPDREDTWLKRPNAYCPEYMKELTRVKDLYEQEIIRNHSELVETLEKNTGKKIETLMDVFFIYQGFLSKESMNLPLPEWAKSVYPEPLASFGSQQIALENYNTKLRRLNGGNIIRKFLWHFNLYTNGLLEPKGRKMFIYSGHEINAINVQCALDMFKPPFFPGYASSVLFEFHFHNVAKDYGIKLFYRNGHGDEFHNLEIPSCGKFCPLDKFVQLTESIIPTNYTEECGANIDIHTLID